MSDELARAAKCPIHEINPMHPELLQSPWGMNKRLRDEAPVFQDPNTGIFFISRYDDVVKMAMGHPRHRTECISLQEACF